MYVLCALSFDTLWGSPSASTGLLCKLKKKKDHPNWVVSLFLVAEAGLESTTRNILCVKKCIFSPLFAFFAPFSLKRRHFRQSSFSRKGKYKGKLCAKRSVATNYVLRYNNIQTARRDHYA
jgi:hypothetical protein